MAIRSTASESACGQPARCVVYGCRPPRGAGRAPRLPPLLVNSVSIAPGASQDLRSPWPPGARPAELCKHKGPLCLSCHWSVRPLDRPVSRRAPAAPSCRHLPRPNLSRRVQGRPGDSGSAATEPPGRPRRAGKVAQGVPEAGTPEALLDTCNQVAGRPFHGGEICRLWVPLGRVGTRFGGAGGSALD